MDSNKLLIIGAGGFGREILGWIRAYQLPFEFIGFIDDVKTADDVVGPIKGHTPVVDVRYACALGAPADRHAVVTQLESAGARFPNVLSPRAMLASPLPQDAGIIALGEPSVANDVQIGRHVLLQGFSIIGHNVTVGPYSTVSSFAFVGGWARIGSLVTLHPHCTILPRMVVEDHAVVGAGSVVTRRVSSNTTVFGNPARILVKS